MSHQLFPAYHAIGPQLVADVPTIPPTYVSVSLAPALYTEEKFHDHFAYSCVLHCEEQIHVAELENYIGFATEAIGKIVGFSAFPFHSESEQAKVAFSPADIENKKDGGMVIPFSIMVRPTVEVFMQAVTIIDMQAMAVEGARIAGVLQVPNAAESLLSTPTATSH